VPRILVIAECGTYGGTRTFLLKLLKFHQRQRIETAVVLEARHADPEMLRICEQAQVEVIMVRNRARSFSRAYVSLLYDVAAYWRAFRSFRPDLIVVSSGAVYEMLGVLLFPAPVLFVMHSFLPPTVRSRRAAGMRLFVRLMCRARRIRFVSVSQSAARRVQKCLGVPTSYLSVVYNSSRDITVCQEPRQALVLTVGHVVAYKNPRVWLETARHVIRDQPQVRFVWLGDGEQLEEMCRAIGELDLGKRVIMPGYGPDVDDYYAQSMVYFHPSRVESHGITVVEAMAHGIPCVTSNTGGLPESVVDGETGFTCDPDDVEAFSAHLRALLQDPALRERMGSAARRRAEAVFSEARQEQEFMRLYRTLASRAASSRSVPELQRSEEPLPRQPIADPVKPSQQPVANE
jgi:glycosyltransferase involved in cell wall biosynthesis